MLATPSEALVTHPKLFRYFSGAYATQSCTNKPRNNCNNNNENADNDKFSIYQSLVDPVV